VKVVWRRSLEVHEAPSCAAVRESKAGWRKGQFGNEMKG